MSETVTPVPSEPSASTEAPAVIVAVPEAVAPESSLAPEFTPHTDTPSLLETLRAPGEVAEAPKPDAPAVVEPEKAAEPAAPEAPKPVEPPAPEPVVLEPIVYPEWKLPEGIQPDKEALGKYSEILGEHRIAPEVGQALLDKHTEAMRQYAEHLSREQHRVFGETRANWNKEIMADPELGGAGHQTAMGAIARMRDRFISSAKPGTDQYKSDESAFNQFLAITGAGDHPQFHKMLHRIAAVLDEPRLPPPNAGPVPNGGAPKRTGMASIYRNSSDARGGQ
jgi:hypothetical protein